MTEAASPSDPPVRKRRRCELATTRRRPLPSKEELLLWFRYNPETGVLYKIAIKRGRPAQRALLEQPRAISYSLMNGHLACYVHGRLTLVSRVIWVMQTGDDPGAKDVDHINGNQADNRWSNLRLADRHQNQCNRRRPQANTLSKYRGVTFRRNSRGEIAYIKAQIQVRGKHINLGYHPTEEAAYAAYCEAAKKYHGDFARLE